MYHPPLVSVELGQDTSALDVLELTCHNVHQKYESSTSQQTILLHGWSRLIADLWKCKSWQYKYTTGKCDHGNLLLVPQKELRYAMHSSSPLAQVLKDIITSRYVSSCIYISLFFLFLSVLKQLCEEKDTVHCDMSYSNILLLENNEANAEGNPDESIPVSFCPDLLIDVDCLLHIICCLVYVLFVFLFLSFSILHSWCI